MSTVTFVKHWTDEVGSIGAVVRFSLDMPRVPVKGETLSIGPWNQRIDEVTFSVSAVGECHHHVHVECFMTEIVTSREMLTSLRDSFKQVLKEFNIP